MSSKSSREKLRHESVSRIFKRFLPYLRQHRKTLFKAGLCTLGLVIAELLKPWPLKVLFDGLLIPQATGKEMAGWLAEIPLSPEGILGLTVLAIVLIALLLGVFGYGQSYLSTCAGERMVADVRHALYAHIQRLSHSFHDTIRTGDLLARLTGDIQTLREVMVNTLIYVMDRSLALVCMFGLMLWMDWALTLVALSTLPLLIWCAAYFTHEVKGATRRRRRHESQITSDMTERLSAIKVVQAFAREAHEQERFAHSNRGSLKAGLHAVRMSAHLTRLAQVILAMGSAAVLWFGVRRVQVGVLTPGDLLVFTAYLSAFYKPMKKFVDLANRLAKAVVCGERVMSILDTRPEIFDAPHAKPAPRLAGDIQFEGVSFSYNARKPVLREVSFRVRPGETVALVGESGSGKSTISSLLLRFYEPSSGRILIDGRELSEYTLTSLREQISVVLQDTVLFNGSVRDNIGYGNLDATDEEIEAAARDANAHEFIAALPDGYDTEIMDRGKSLSGGQRQRIAIARAIVRNAPILILDEPAVGLDPRAQAEVQVALDRLTEHKTCITITHDLASASEADHVWSVRDGRLHEVRVRELVEVKDSLQARRHLFLRSVGI